MSGEKALTHRVSPIPVGRFFAGFTHVMVVGGGASLVRRRSERATGVVKRSFLRRVITRNSRSGSGYGGNERG
ncbi:hypothetical protein AB9K36_02370 [Klebsiella michiganensis]